MSNRCLYCGYSPDHMARIGSDLCPRCFGFHSTTVYAFYSIAQQHKTVYPTDLISQGMLLHAAKAYEKQQDMPGFYLLVRTMIMEARASWKQYLVLQQRKWQTQHGKNKNRAKHHDSVEIREKYVRIGSEIQRV